MLKQIVYSDLKTWKPEGLTEYGKVTKSIRTAINIDSWWFNFLCRKSAILVYLSITKMLIKSTSKKSNDITEVNLRL